jgi:NAD-dependent SIR2 family protein deacetylase
VLTTNVDHWFQKTGFDKHRLFYTQGDYGLFQCSQPCCNKTYDNEKMILEMIDRQRDMKIPTELIPTCPVCGKPMAMNLRSDDKFVQDEGWYRANDRYSDFIRRHRNLHVLYLELGVGFNTPGIIKYPFWRMTAENPNSFYACLNHGEAACPSDIADRSVCLNGDIAKML